MNEHLKKWIQLAELDLKSAKDLLNNNEPVTSAICFHCQQTVEKYLKAFLIYNQKEISRTHDLTFLINQCIKIDEEFKILFELEVDTLTFYAVELRYPDDFYIPTLDEARNAIELAHKTKEFINRKLNM